MRKLRTEGVSGSSREKQRKVNTIFLSDLLKSIAKEDWKEREKKDISSHVQDGISCNATTEYLAETSTDLHAATKGIYDQTLKFVS